MLSGFRHQQFFLGCTGWGFSFQTILCLFVSIHSNHVTFLLRALNWLPVAFSLGWNALFSCLKGWNCYFELIEEASVIFGWWSQYYTKKNYISLDILLARGNRQWFGSGNNVPCIVHKLLLEFPQHYSSEGHILQSILFYRKERKCREGH